MNYEVLEQRVALSAVPFSELTISAPQVGHPHVVESADIDQDGDIDVITFGDDNDELVWIENQGQGTFESVHPIAIRSNGDPQIATADFDGDGDSDLIVGDYATVEIVWYRNEGGVFAEANLIAELDRPSSIDAGDIDLDGDTDIVALSQYNEVITWFRNDGEQGITRIDTTQFDCCLEFAGRDGRIEATQLHPNDSPVVTIGDLRNVYRVELNSGQVLERTDHGARSFVLTTRTNDQTGATTSVTEDYVVATSRNGVEGPFIDSFTSVLRSPPYYSATDAEFADVDGDSVDEVIFAIRTNHELFWVEIPETEPDGTEAKNAITTNGAPFVSSIIAADLDGDSQREIVFNKPLAGEIVAFEFNGGLPQPAQIVANHSADPAFAARPFAIFDFNNDGTNEIIIPSLSVDEVTAEYKGAVGADLDEDGKLELVTFGIGLSGDEWQLLWGDSIDKLTPLPIGDLNISESSSFDIADMDQDGDLDILASLNEFDAINETDSNVVWFENVSGSGSSWKMHFVTAVPSGVRSIGAADVDGDGDLDIHLSAIYDGELLWYRNLGRAANFSEDAIAISTRANLVRQMRAADLDQDGDVDFVAISSADRALYWYENNGAGLFQTQHRVSDSISGSALEIADIDEDGDLDLFAANHTNGKLFWFRNDLDTGSRRGDFNQDSIVDVSDLDHLCTAIAQKRTLGTDDLHFDGIADRQDLDIMVRDILRTVLGDSNGDGIFDSSDLVKIFQDRQYEDQIEGNSTWSRGDWNCDGDFDSTDLVTAFRHSTFVAAAMPQSAVAGRIAWNEKWQAPNSQDLPPTIIHRVAGSPLHDTTTGPRSVRPLVP